MSMQDGDANRRRARRTALILGVLALAFYIGIFCLVHWRHTIS
ncbi:MAG: hypothetical protein ACRETO_03075 [Gammaproteobacteria bacterium]